jgi:hypothetical protein
MNSEKYVEGAAADASEEAPLRVIADEELLHAWGGGSVPVSSSPKAGH